MTRGGDVTVERVDDAEAARLLDDLTVELTGRGLVEGVNFLVVGRPLPDLPASEIVGIGFEDGVFRTFFRDSATPRTLAESTDFETVRTAFVRDVYRLSPFRHVREQAPGGDR